ncbi:MAG: DUF262 domain-containing protein [Gemmatimonadetes bacterium]|nr:DUF262 domain-containing protein [Gemmatimonadota bacterium]MYE95454.1 DUF262 domain-containing protein [Gemmatimonadota bacterium]MYJ12099.1 DUF262 domain-containing protein [Gemmatimonadota bacterium]
MALDRGLVVQADEMGFLELLGGKVQYHVPKWQRRYCWNAADVRRLVEDLVSIAAAANSKRAHYGGSLITFCPPGQPAGVPTTERVVDGQQRLTTVSLLLACVADQMDDGDQYGEWTREGIRDLLRNRKKRESGRLRKLRLQDGDEDEYVRILRGEPKGKGAVTKAWRVVRELVGDYGADTVMAGLERFRIVSLGVVENDDPQQIFESLNATGKALEESEKVKNWLLMGFSDAEQQELYEKYWLKIEKELKAQHSSKPVDLFLRDLMRWRTGTITAIHQTYDVFRRWARETEWDDQERRPKLFRELAHLARLYGMLTGTAGPHPEDAIESSLRHLRAMGLHTHRPFTLRLLHELSPADGDAISTVEQTGRIFETVATWITRLWLTDRTAGLNTAFARLAARGPVDREAYLDDWMRRIRKLGRQDVGVPSDEDLVRGIHTKHMYYGKQARLAVLYALMEDEDGDDAPSRAALWTERVMPYWLTDDWREMLGADAEEKHWAWRYRLANLVLVGSANDAPGEHQSFDVKKECYRRSPVSLTKRVAEQPSWDEATLVRRSSELAKRAVRVWPWEHGPADR